LPNHTIIIWVSTLGGFRENQKGWHSPANNNWRQKN